MLWASFKATVVLLVPICAFSYAQQLHRQAECRRIQNVFQSPTNVQWALTHPREMLDRSNAEARYLRPMLHDLEQ
jgi:hypothetical protein